MYKKTTIILFILFCVNGLFAQVNNSKSLYLRRLDSLEYTKNSKHTYKYDADNRLKEQISYSLYKILPAHYTLAHKKKYSYANDDIYPTSVKIYKSNHYPFTNWIAETNKLYYYDSNGNDTLIIEKEFYNSNWRNAYKYRKLYNSNGYLYKTIMQTWNANNSTWNGSYETTRIYNSSNGLLAIVNMDEKYIFTRDANNRVKSFVFQIFDGSYWESWYKIMYYYDYKGDMNKYYEYFNYSNYWELSSRYDFTYDTTYKINDIALPISFKLDDDGLAYVNFQVNRPLFSLIYKRANYSWNLTTDSVVYYYKDLTNGINKKPEKESISIFPNPATNKIVISSLNDFKGASYSILNIEGIELKRGNINNEHNITIKLNELPAGMYILKLEKEGYYISKKFIITDD